MPEKFSTPQNDINVTIENKTVKVFASIEGSMKEKQSMVDPKTELNQWLVNHMGAR